MEYKVGRLLGNKPKEGVLTAITAKLKDGDIIKLTSDIMDSVSLRAAVTIDGQGHTIHIEEGSAGLNLHHHCTIKNCHFLGETKTNAIISRKPGLVLTLENCTFSHKEEGDYSPSLYTAQPLKQLVTNEVVMDYGQINASSVIGTSFKLGNPQHKNYSYINTKAQDDSLIASELHLDKLEVVKTNIRGYGHIGELQSLESSVRPQGNTLTLDKYALSLALDSEYQLKQEVLTGLIVLGSLTINQVVTPEFSEQEQKRMLEQVKVFKVNTDNPNDKVLIGGTWSAGAKWLNQIWSGEVKFLNYTDVNTWWIAKDSISYAWENSSVKFREDFERQPVEPVVQVEEKPVNQSAEDKLEEMIGLEDVKKKVKTYVYTNIANKKRKEMGQPVTANSLHLIFGGSPGTGKTVVARLLADILYEHGISQTNKMVEVTVKDMIGQYLGQTSPKTHELIESARGGVLFIDEAYELIPENQNDTYKKEAITTLIADMENYRSDLIVIMAGYTAEMQTLMQSNPGLASRFINKIEFPDYTAEELIAIAELELKKQGQLLEEDAKQVLESFIIQEKQAGRVDGNGRWVRNILQFIGQARDMRIVMDGSIEQDDRAVSIIKECDVLEGSQAN
ncbi:AAA family ATPase [Vagococcus fessus]|uniref:AAA+ ATPase domain-containing protein n=1 Tax=Vagococcus fessus TaxID=120370 RepID=A0A430A8T0_9ENTE|nr:AAA family ATPase [Vagococcus fessus]RSU03516.1 hypothetical protein CBF31_07330 [Vagococcus fessus]